MWVLSISVEKERFNRLSSGVPRAECSTEWDRNQIFSSHFRFEYNGKREYLYLQTCTRSKIDIFLFLLHETKNIFDQLEEPRSKITVLEIIVSIPGSLIAGAFQGVRDLETGDDLIPVWVGRVLADGAVRCIVCLTVLHLFMSLPTLSSCAISSSRPSKPWTLSSYSMTQSSLSSMSARKLSALIASWQRISPLSCVQRSSCRQDYDQEGSIVPGHNQTLTFSSFHNECIT